MQLGVPVITAIRGLVPITAAAAVGGGEQTLNSKLKPNHMCSPGERDLTMALCRAGAGK